MVVLDDATAEVIINMHNFKTQTHHLANELHISDNDAAQMIFVHLCDKRFKKYDLESFKTLLKEREDLVSWAITYSFFDIKKKYFNDQKRSQETLMKLKHVANVSYSDVESSKNKELQKHTDELKELVLTNANQLFGRSSCKKKFAEKLLNNGVIDAMDGMNGTFNYNLKIISKYFEDNHERVEKVISENNKVKNQKVLNCINTLLRIEDSEASLFEKDGKQAEVIEHNSKLIEDLIGRCGENGTTPIKQQYQLLHDWCHADNSEKLNFIQYLRTKRYELLNKLGVDDE